MTYSSSASASGARGRCALLVQPARESLFAKYAHGATQRPGKLSATSRAFGAPKPQSTSSFPRLSAPLSPNATYHGCCSTCTSPLESAAARPGSPRTSASPARSSMRGKVPHSVPLRRTSRSTLWTLTWNTSVCVNRQHLVWFGQVQRMPKYRGNAQNGIPGIVAGTDGSR